MALQAVMWNKQGNKNKQLLVATNSIEEKEVWSGKQSRWLEVSGNKATLAIYPLTSGIQIQKEAQKNVAPKTKTMTLHYESSTLTSKELSSSIFESLSVSQSVIDKAPRPSIGKFIWIMSSDTIGQLNQLFSNSLLGIGNTWPDLHFFQYIKAYMPYNDQVPSRINQDRILTQTDCLKL